MAGQRKRTVKKGATDMSAAAAKVTRMPVVTTQRTSVQTILDRSVCLTIERHFLGNYRKVRTEDVVEAAGGEASKVDGAQVKSTKRLIDSKELLSVMRVLEQAVVYLRRTAIPSHRVFGDRTYLVPIRLVETVDAELNEYRRKLAVEVALLAERYEGEIEKQKERLGPLFDRADYPTAAQVRASFGLDWNYVSFAAPERLETVGRALFERAQEKFARKMNEAYEEARLVHRETLRHLVGEVARKLAPPTEPGKTKVFKNTILDELVQFLDTFKVRDITDDVELDKAVARLRQLTKGMDPEQLRDADNLREQAFKQMTAAVGHLDKLVKSGRRAISFGEIGGE